MAGARPPASLPPCSLISDCCASNQRDSVGVGPSEPGAGYNLVVRRFFKPVRKAQYSGGSDPSFPGASVTPFFDSERELPDPLRFPGEAMPRPASARAQCAHPLTCAHCLALPSEMNPVPQMEMQKSSVFCVAHAGSCRPELFLFSHLGSSPRVLESEKSRIGVLAYSVPGKGCLPGLQLNFFLLCLHKHAPYPVPIRTPDPNSAHTHTEERSI
nr:uncharacterized protein LOC107967572 isoform X1 [Pan troglodytes]